MTTIAHRSAVIAHTWDTLRDKLKERFCKGADEEYLTLCLTERMVGRLNRCGQVQMLL